MRIKNGMIFSENGSFIKGDVFTLGERIVTKEHWEQARNAASSRDSSDDFQTIDASGAYVIPGLIDVHSHGAMGCDFSDADTDGLRKILAYEYAHGITAYCPTSMTLPSKRLKDIFASAAAEDFSFLNPCEKHLRRRFPYARIAGFHMEGPFLDPIKKGAHVKRWIQPPDVAVFHQCQEAAGGNIRLVTIAPNMPGAMDFIRELKDQVVLSLGHTSCDYDTGRRAIRAGACRVTHLYNAMGELLHRSPGLIGAALDESNCMVELISDGIHCHDSMIRSAFTLFEDRVVLISDSLRATGLGDGTCDLGGQEVTVRGPLATLSDGTIAGSVSNLYDNMLHAVDAGIPKETAILAVTANPAKSIGIYGTIGSITPGKLADLLMVDENLRLLQVLTPSA